MSNKELRMSKYNKSHFPLLFVISCSLFIIHFFPIVCLFTFLLFRNSSGADTPRETKVLTDQIRAQKGGTYITLSRGVTQYELTGPEEGNVVVFIHGASLAMWVWDRQVEPFRKAGFRVLRYNHYGRGLSDYLQTTYDRDLYRTQLGELLDSLGITEPVSFIVHSFGGFIASYFTASFPERVDKVVFIAPGVTVSWFTKAIVKSPVAQWYIHHTLENLPNTIDKKFQKQGIPLVPYKNMYLEQLEYQGFEQSLVSLYADAIDDYLPYYREIGRQKRPVLLIRGTDDNTAREKPVKKALKAMPQAQFKPLEGVGHVPQFEATEAVNTLLLEFIGNESDTK